MIHYRYQHSATKATTGYFACEPEPEPSFAEALTLLTQRPMDDFLRRHILRRAADMDADLLAEALQTALEQSFALAPESGPSSAHGSAHDSGSSAVPDSAHGSAHGSAPSAEPSPARTPAPAPCSALEALRRELLLLRPGLAGQPFFARARPAGETAGASPLIFLRRESLPDKQLQERWVAAFNGNIQEHRSLKNVARLALPPLYPPPGQEAEGPGLGKAFTRPFTATIAELYPAHAAALSGDGKPLAPPAAETASLAEDRLKKLDIIAGAEMRHTASLSPVALLRPWRMRLEVRQGAHSLSLTGQATTYGRGLSLDAARVSCLMEMVERASCYVSVDGLDLLDRPGPCRLVRGSFREVVEKYGPAVNPDDFPLETPYAGQNLYWVCGHGPGIQHSAGHVPGSGSVNKNSEPGSAGAREAAPVWLPLQMAALFCNLDEISLMDAPGSTGIATGASMEQAKVAALLELFERDAEATSPFVKEDCFRLEADPDKNPLEAALLADYEARGIRVQFQDLSGPTGLPVYQCFVMSAKGAVFRGHGASLCGARAALSALTETPFPYPDGGPSGPALRNLPVRKLHELPDYSLPSYKAQLGLLEDLLVRNKRPPVYVDMTRKGLDFPVVRALAPGLELAADRDAFSRVPLRLYRAWETFAASMK